MKRIGLFLLTNLAVMVVLAVVLSVAQSYLGISSQSNAGILLLALVFGMGGSFISLAMSKWMALRTTGAQVIAQPRTAQEVWLMETVRRLSQQAGIGMPEVAIYDADDVNAFATGMNKNNALVAVSSGLLNAMSRDEAEAVIGHEITHVANGDMVTLTLIQGVVNTFVIFAARIVANALNSYLGGNDREGGLGMIGYMATVIVLQLLFGILASVIVMAFSRAREYRADAGGARLVGRDKMIAALQRLQSAHEESALPQTLTAFGISSEKSSWGELFMSHPPLEKRIRALKEHVTA